MRVFITITFLFCVGAIVGWCIEVVFRKNFSSANPEHKWINPGFCLGPWLPLYGFGLLGLYGISTYLNLKLFSNEFLNTMFLFLVMAISMTFVEFIAGEYCQRILKVKLWDYTECWGNIDGVVCPLFTVFWGILGLIYYFFMHPYVEYWVSWLNGNPMYSFFIGMFYGVFIIDVCYSGNVVGKVKEFAKNNEIIVELEILKQQIADSRKELKQKGHFFLSYHSRLSLQEHLNQFYQRREEMRLRIEERVKKFK